MLFTPVNHFSWTANNFTDKWPGDASATLLTAHATPHTKGSDTACMVGIAEDCYGIAITLSSGATAATVRRQFVDLLIDPAAGVGNAGSSWSVAINNMYSCGPGFVSANGRIGCNYLFPLYLKAGTAIGARTQDTVTVAQIRISLRLSGKPTHPELCNVGTIVQTIGADTATTSGVAVTPGTAAWGSYSASLGTLTRSSWWWQLGIGHNDTSWIDNIYRFDVAHDATAKYKCIDGLIYGIDSNEVSSKSALGEGLPIQLAPAGTDVYVRGTGLGSPEGTTTVVVYAVSS